MDTMTVILIIIAYVIIMRFILPKIGIPTWMSKSCDFQSGSRNKTEEKIEDEQ